MPPILNTCNICVYIYLITLYVKMWNGDQMIKNLPYGEGEGLNVTCDIPKL